jgi:hypothetical protein
MADLSLSWEPVQVPACETIAICCTSSRLHSLGMTISCIFLMSLIFLQLPDTIQDFYKKNFDTTAPQATLTYLKRELMHAIWELILNDEFMEAYEHGIVIICPDGVSRRFYPRFFTYSADYLEKWVSNDMFYIQFI